MANQAGLSDRQKHILHNEGTEPPFSSCLNNEKRTGTYHCVQCNQPLFHSSKKYDSGSGWPSFYDVIKGAIETKIDHSLFVVRTEYHCSKCKGHQGHVFDDGPEPTGLRYCNNGVALQFIED